MGLKSKLHPIAYRTPCVAMSPATLLTNAEEVKLMMVMARPRGPHHLSIRGKRLRVMKARGIMRYMIPVWDAPIEAIELGEALRFA